MDVDAKDQLNNDLVEEVGRTKGKKAKAAEQSRISQTPSADGEGDDDEELVQQRDARLWRRD